MTSVVSTRLVNRFDSSNRDLAALEHGNHYERYYLVLSDLTSCRRRGGDEAARSGTRAHSSVG